MAERRPDSEFWRAYKHPLWQKKRLEIMERAKFACEECGNNDSTLNVHHRYYVPGKLPWEYPNEHLDCLCEACHATIKQITTELRAAIQPLDSAMRGFILGYIKGSNFDPCREGAILDLSGTNGDVVMGVIASCRLDYERTENYLANHEWKINGCDWLQLFR